MKRAYIDLPYGQMHYRYCGEGKPLIMVHMSGGYSAQFENVSEYLKSRYTIYAIDLFGYGFSDKQHQGKKRFSITEHAQSILDFMDAMKIEQTSIYGTLVGSNCCARAAIKQPERFEKLILCQPIYNEDYNSLRDTLAGFKDIPLSEDGAHMLEIWKRVNRTHPEYSPEISQWRADAYVISGRSCETMHQAMYDEENWITVYPQIKVPTTVIAIELYPSTPQVKLVAKLIPNAELDFYPQSKLYVEVENPKLVSEIILKHLP